MQPVGKDSAGLVSPETLENKGFYRKTPGIVDKEAFCAFSLATDDEEKTKFIFCLYIS